MMRFQVVETKVFIVDLYDETTARMTVVALQNEMQMSKKISNTYGEKPLVLEYIFYGAL